MKLIGSAKRTGVMMLLMGMLVLLFPEGAVAGDPGWRPTYDVAMRWINFKRSGLSGMSRMFS